MHLTTLVPTDDFKNGPVFTDLIFFKLAKEKNYQNLQKTMTTGAGLYLFTIYGVLKQIPH